MGLLLLMLLMLLALLMMMMLTMMMTLKMTLQAACDGRADVTVHRASEASRTSCAATMVTSMLEDIIE